MKKSDHLRAFSLNVVLMSFVSSIALGQANDSSLECTSEALDVLRSAVQGLDVRSPAIADELMKCPKLHDEVLLWKSIYLTFTDRLAETRVPQSGGTSPFLSGWRSQVLGSAARGSYRDLQQLQQLVESKDPNWRDDAESNLVLARAQVRDGRYPSARSSYERYFLLKPDDWDIRIEAVYSLMHDDWLYARKHLDILSQSPLNQRQREAVERAYSLIEVTRGVVSATLVAASRREVPFSYEGFWSSYLHFQRQTLSSGYHKRTYEFDASILSLRSDLPNANQNAVEASMLKRFSLAPRVGLFAKGGWFQGSAGAPVLHLLMSYTFDSESSFAPEIVAGHQSDPWVKFYPLAKEYSSWLQNVELVGFNLKNIFAYRFTHSTIADQGVDRRHSGNLSYPLWKWNQNKDLLYFKLLAETMATERYSPYYYSPKEESVLLPGLLYETKPRDNWQFMLEVDYGVVSATTHPTAALSSTTSSGNLLSAKAELRADLSAEWSIVSVVRHSRSSSREGGVSYDESLLGVSALWYFDRLREEKGTQP